MKFVIMDMVSNGTAICKIESNNGKNALKQFLLTHAMSAGMYEIKKETYCWAMRASFGRYFKALPIKE